jgi:hypothetical protein
VDLGNVFLLGVVGRVAFQVGLWLGAGLLRGAEVDRGVETEDRGVDTPDLGAETEARGAADARGAEAEARGAEAEARGAGAEACGAEAEARGAGADARGEDFWADSAVASTRAAKRNRSVLT